MKRHIVFAAAVAAQLAVLASMGLTKAADVRSGTRITLRVVPVDPNDLFRGEYVQLTYDCSRIQQRLWQGPPTAAGGDAWVLLEPRNGDWVATRASLARGPEVPGGVWLKGRCDSLSPNGVRVVFGLEQFFVRQGRGPRIEAAVRNHAVFAEVAVTKDGTGTLTALLVNGERIE